MTERSHSAPEQLHAPGAMDQDWPEDFAHENGQYLCGCCYCGLKFFGHKRRVVCRICSTTQSTVSETAPSAAYAAANPLGGVAKMFDTMASRIRAGESFDSVLADYGLQTTEKTEAELAALKRELVEAVAKEREECAALAAMHFIPGHSVAGHSFAEKLANKIRARAAAGKGGA